MSNIEKSRGEHFLHEYQTWERTLDFFITENAFLKTRLSSFLDNDADKIFLQVAENFQTKFLQIDELIKNLQHYVVEMEKFAEQKKNSDEKIFFESIKNRQKKIRQAIGKLEIDFIKVKNNFNNYVVKSL